MAILEVKNLNLGFNCECGFRQALFDVSFTLEKGKMHALVGESGCGKTMSAMSILNLIPKTAKITSGKIIFQKEDLLKKSQKEMQNFRGSKIALIPQDPMTSLNPLYTVGDQLFEILKIHQNLQGDEAVKKAIEAFEGGIKIKPDFADFYYSLGVAQADLADELVEETEDKKEITEEDKLKAVELKKAAVENLTKYIELKPTAEDKKTIEELIEESNSFINGDDNSAKEDAE